MTPVDLAVTANIESHSSLEWFTGLPFGPCEAEGISFELNGPMVLTHGLVEDGRARFRPDLPDVVSIPVGMRAPFIGFLHTGLFK